MTAQEALPMESTDPVFAIQKWADNGALIAACARLSVLRREWRTLDATYGYGTFWSQWKPDNLTACDLNPAKSPIGYGVDFTDMPFNDRSFDAVVFDPPYKLNGTPTDTAGIDERFGVSDATDWRERMRLIRAGARECARVADKVLLVKCQDQVVSSVIRWQTKAVAEEVEPLGFGLRHRYDFESFRPQPEGRAQRNPYACSSQLLVFERGWWWSDLPKPKADAR